MKATTINLIEKWQGSSLEAPDWIAADKTPPLYKNFVFKRQIVYKTIAIIMSNTLNDMDTDRTRWTRQILKKGI